jgi:hypothetical protein
MPPADQPSNPSDELASRRAWTGPTLANGVLTAELAEFCQSGVSVVMATCGADGRPVVGRGLACRIDRSGNARVLLRAASNAAFLGALGDGAGLAVTFTQPSTHRSIQLKAGGAILSTVDASDGAAVAVQTTGLRAELVDDGYSEAFAAAYCGYEPDELAAVDFVPESAFVQTPGPNAGSALQP